MAIKRRQRSGFTFEVVKAVDFHPRRASITLVAGPAGTGKSNLLGEMCEGKRSLLITTLEREASSEKYQIFNPDHISLNDDGWDPEPPDEYGGQHGTYEASGFLKFIELVKAVRADDIVDGKTGKPFEVVLIDSGTGLGEFAWHEALSRYGIMDPAYMEQGESRFGPYTALDGLMSRAFSHIQKLRTCENPKLVGLSWHVQPAKEDQEIVVRGANYTKTKQSKDNRGKESEYLGDFLPLVRGGFRRKLFTLVDVVVWTHIEHVKQTHAPGKPIETRPQYMLQVVTDTERHCKLPGAVPPDKYIPNAWKHLQSLLVKDV